jgi:hypothetical protein
MSGTLISFMLTAIGGRQLSGQLTTFQILFFRSIKGTPNRPNRCPDKKITGQPEMAAKQTDQVYTLDSF